MYTLQICAHPECFKQVISRVSGDVLEPSDFCLVHSPDPHRAEGELHDYIAVHEKIIAMNASELTFSNDDFSRKKFYGCNFQHCRFENIHSEGCRMRISVLDFSVFSDCSLLASNLQYVSFAGCTFARVLFTGSDMVHNNFNGITSHQTSFDDSDLYNSRFIRAKLTDTSIRNCNIKKTIFYGMTQENVSFKLSNTREAFFTLAGAEL